MNIKVVNFFLSRITRELLKHGLMTNTKSSFIQENH